MIEHYSSKIQNVIQRELFKASNSVKLAVAWFTNDLLFQPLLLKLHQGVSVEIILNDDEINKNGDNSIDFTPFIQVGGILRWNSSSRLMHDKFCIIDDNVVIFGSYNWTFKAEYNEESISVARNEPTTLTFYKNKFSKLTSRYQQVIQDEQEQCIGTCQKVGNGPSLMPKQLLPYLNLNFYDNVEIRLSIPDTIRYCFAWEGEYHSKTYCFLNDISFSPLNNIRFEDYKLIQRDNPSRNIWIKVFGKWGLYSISNQKFIIEPQFDRVSYGKYDQGTILTVEKNGKQGAIDVSGKEIIPLKYSRVFVATDLWIELEINRKKGVWSKGEFVFECIYDELRCDGKYPSKLNNRYGVIKGSEIIIPFEYDEVKYIEPFGIGIHYMRKSDKWGGHLCKDLHRREKFVPCVYDNKEQVDKALGW